MTGVLDGLKIVAMEQKTVIPLASAYLADWGADVIKVEPVTSDRSRETGRVIAGVPTSIKVGAVEVNTAFQFHNRNKMSLAVDLKKKSGRDILCQLVQKADVFMSNYEVKSLNSRFHDNGDINLFSCEL